VAVRLDKLPKRVHLATIWAAALGSALSAMFILAANSWMQHPVGYVMVNGKPQLTDIWAVFTNPVFVWGYAKVLFVALVTGTVVMLAVSAWQLRCGGDREVFLWVATWAAVLPFLMNTAGWFLTESGRQPWIVHGIMLTKNGISPTVSVTWLWISLIGFIALYGMLGTVDLILMLRYSRKELPAPRTEATADTPVPAVQY
jgi:cytochrome bd-type quinol oxidase subunit 1